MSASAYPSWLIVLSAALGFLLQLLFAWQEWSALTRQQSLKTFIVEDVPGFLIAVLLSIAGFIVAPELDRIAWVRETFDFPAERTPMSAFASSFILTVLGYQWRAMLGRNGARPPTIGT